MTKQYKMGPLFTPPIVRPTDGKLGTLQLPGNQGSALWQGASWDPETNMLYVPSVSNMTVQALQPGGTRSDMTYIGGAGGGGDPDAAGAGRGAGAAPAAAAPAARAAGPAPQAGPTSAGPAGAGGAPAPAAPAAAAARTRSRELLSNTRVRARGGPVNVGPGVSRGPWGLGPQGLPLMKPPYGRITAYNMNTGDIVWQVANGETYDWIKNHPALKGLDLPKTGRADEGGIVVTKTLMFAGQGCGLFRSGAGGSQILLRLRQEDRRCGPHDRTAGRNLRQADDLHDQRQAVHRGVGGLAHHAGGDRGAGAPVAGRF